MNYSYKFEPYYLDLDFYMYFGVSTLNLIFYLVI